MQLGSSDIRHWHSNDIDEHMGLIRRQVERSVRDGETRQLAVKLVSGTYDYATDPQTGKKVPIVEAYGRRFRAPESGIGLKPRDEQGEVIAIWDFVILNVRYVYDPPQIDTFAVAKHTLDAGGGDCDDFTILFCALLQSIGFHTAARVVSVKQDPKNWVHVYPLVALPKDNPKNWLPLDATVEGFTPGDEWPDIAKTKDYQMG